MSWFAKHKVVAVLVLGAGGYYLWKRTQRVSCSSPDAVIHPDGKCYRTGSVSILGIDDYGNATGGATTASGSPFGNLLDDNGNPLITSPWQL